MLDLEDKDRLELLLAQRTSFYEQADVIVPIEDPKDIDASVIEVQSDSHTVEAAMLSRNQLKPRPV